MELINAKPRVVPSTWDTRVVPSTWDTKEAAGMFVAFATFLYHRDGVFPSWFPVESPNFYNFKMPRHKFIVDNRIEIKNELSMQTNKTKYYGEMLDWIYSFTKGNWNYGYNDNTHSHYWYFDDKDDAMLFKLTWCNNVI